MLWRAGHTPVVGVDEAGRGALAGPVVAAAVVLPVGEHPYRDSKTLKGPEREELAARARAEALAWAVGEASEREVDALGILKATHLAAARALRRLGPAARGAALVTDYLALEWPGPVLAVPRADQRSVQAAAASILAKTHRDRLMRQLAREYPGYGFERHVGYGTPQHRRALLELGPCDLHRLSFAPVAAAPLFGPARNTREEGRPVEWGHGSRSRPRK